MNLSLLTAAAALALATALPASVQAPAEPTAKAQAAGPREGSAAVEGGEVHYYVHGDLNSGKTPLLVLHGSYMSAEAMRPLVEPFVADRPVIVIDQRGHGRTGDLPGPITYELLADDAAAVLQALQVGEADVLGYSMGGNAAIVMAVHHPDRVGKLIPVSGTFRGWYPVVLDSMSKMTADFFAGTPMEAEYKRLSPTPDAFPTLVEELRVLDTTTPDVPESDVRAIDAKTMVIIGDADGVMLEHAVELFKLRGGGDTTAAVQGFMSEAPRARLAILPATSHIGIMAEGELIARLVKPFLDDVAPTMPPGFF